MAPRSTNIVQLGTYIACPLLPKPNETRESFGSVRNYISCLCAKKMNVGLCTRNIFAFKVPRSTVQDDNLSRGPCILKGFWKRAACFFVYFIIKIRGRAGLNCEMGGACSMHGRRQPRLTKCQGYYKDNRTVPSLAISLRMRICTSISTRLCRILMD